MGLGVFGAPCNSATTVATEVNVSPAADLTNITTMFNCEDGEFEVYWSGAVNVSGTIVIGKRTTVTIFGDQATPSSSITSNSSSFDIGTHVEELTSPLALPLGLTSAAVGIGNPDESASGDTTTTSGAIFSVDGGTLVLQDLIVRDGYRANATDDATGDESARGGGIYAMSAKVNITRCEFMDNFAVYWGGGIYTEESTLVVVDSVFDGCQAGFQSPAEDNEHDGVGGGIAVSTPYRIR